MVVVVVEALMVAVAVVAVVGVFVAYPGRMLVTLVINIITIAVCVWTGYDWWQRGTMMPRHKWGAVVAVGLSLVSAGCIIWLWLQG